jgi:hypothetical protein
MIGKFAGESNGYVYATNQIADLDLAKPKKNEKIKTIILAIAKIIS